jgi:superfamily II DNA or RNA helicase
MNFRNLILKESYGTSFEDENVVESFYAPVLASTIEYSRAAGYFSSRSFVSAASGIASLVKNGGSMRLVTSHAFTKADTIRLQEYYGENQLVEDLYKNFSESFNDLRRLGNEIASNHLLAMCWMLKEGILDVKIVIPNGADLTSLTPSEIDKFHPKFGIMTDVEGNQIAFSGSINETLNAWNYNVENFDVYRSWEQGQGKYISPKVDLFEKYWSGHRNTGSWKTIDLPAAVRERIVDDFAPNDFPEWNQTPKSTDKNLGFERSYQSKAVDSWVKNDFRGVLEMATGTGKTRTAKKAIDKAKSLGSLLTVVVVPYKHIGTQWVEELEGYSAESIGGNKWAERLEDTVYKAKLGRIAEATLVVVKNTASSSKFLEILTELAEYFDNFLLIGDEVHWLGAVSYQKAMVEQANLRLGLSATPNRYFDEIGTSEIYRYFGSATASEPNEPIFRFGIREALAFRTPNGSRILTPYKYHPEFVVLTETEQHRYVELFNKITKLKNSTDDLPNKQQILESLYIKLADIAKTAENKIPSLEKLLDSIPQRLEKCIIYCADSSQMEKVAVMLQSRNIDVQRITSNENAHPSKEYAGASERQHILDNFENGLIDVLLAIDCLDEGVDIPAAKLGFILASSGNAKEFIQRRGRLMRTSQGKEYAEIFDFCVLPNHTSSDSAARKIISKELKRVAEFAEDAENAEEVTKIINQIKGE